MLNFNQKETSLLQDQKKHEELCIKKYSNYSNQTQDTELKQLLIQIGQQEQQHLDSINQMLGGQLPAMGGQQGGQTNTAPAPSPQQGQTGLSSQSDADMCEDLLTTEKYVSATYTRQYLNSGIQMSVRYSIIYKKKSSSTVRRFTTIWPLMVCIRYRNKILLAKKA